MRPRSRGCFVVEGEARSVVIATGSGTRLAAIASLTHAQQSSPTPLHLELTRVSRDPRGSRDRCRCRVLPDLPPGGHEGVGRLPLRCRSHGRSSARRSAPDGHVVARDRRAADGDSARAGAPPRGGGDAGLDHLHLHRQDRHVDAQRDGSRRGVDARRRGRGERCGVRARSQSGVHATVVCDGGARRRADCRALLIGSSCRGRGDVGAARRSHGGGARRVRSPRRTRDRRREGPGHRDRTVSLRRAPSLHVRGDWRNRDGQGGTRRRLPPLQRSSGRDRGAAEAGRTAVCGCSR